MYQVICDSKLTRPCLTHHLVYFGRQMSAAVTPSGILAVFGIPSSPLSHELTGPGVVLANISDPGNMGTLIRTAAALGVRTVVIQEGSDPWSPKVVQASAGMIGHVCLFQSAWDQVMKLQLQEGIETCALVVQGGEQPRSICDRVDAKRLLLVVGNEAHGIPPDVLQGCQHRMTIPMPGDGVESLNASVAGSIAMYLMFQGKKP
mmetsp:Transcript_8427/g.13769  ORF Transcript_8427/g.13769 Transcript_8427/m.13769 type:complete len:204 (+) Transcript_8427:547-1158(+)